jgi:hypothetical protein
MPSRRHAALQQLRRYCLTKIEQAPRGRLPTAGRDSPHAACARSGADPSTTLRGNTRQLTAQGLSHRGLSEVRDHASLAFGGFVRISATGDRRARALLWAFLSGAASMYACGNTTETASQKEPPGHGATGGRAQAGADAGSDATSSGGASGESSGAIAAGGGGSELDAARDGRSREPAWHPDLPLGSPGWRSSTSPFCAEIVGPSSTSILSTPSAVYVLVDSQCPTYEGRRCVPEAPVDNEILYRNDGTGWRTLLRRPGGGGKLVGFANGGVVIIDGSTACKVTHVSDAAGALCLDPGADGGVSRFATGAVADDGSLILLGETDPYSGRTTLVRYAHGAWSTLKTWIGEEPLDFSLHGTRIFVAGANQFLWAGDIATGDLHPIAKVPANDYVNVWSLSDSLFVASDVVGRLTRYDAGRWTVTETGLSKGILRLWGAPDGTVFAIDNSTFGRYANDAFASISTSTGANAPERYVDLTGNSASEVFLAVASFESATCGDTYLVWYDGKTFHQF